MSQSNIFIRDGSIAAKKPDGTNAFWWMGEDNVSLLALLARVCFTLNTLYPDADFTITDQRTFKPLPVAEENRVNLDKAA